VIPDEERTMSELHTSPADRGTAHGATEHRHGRHGWMMIICCMPMLVVGDCARAGVVSANFLFAAVACAAMMALMMRGMSHGDSDS
jgi:hypothetical protein